MRKLLFSLAGGGALALSVPGAARPLPTGVAFDVFLDDGPSQSAMGAVRFFPGVGGPVPGGACRYTMEWSSGFDDGPVAVCKVDEATWHGHQSCPDNAAGLIPSIVVRAPGQPCTGLDQMRAIDVFQLVLGESDGAPSFVGLVQFTPASSEPYGVLIFSAP